MRVTAKLETTSIKQTAAGLQKDIQIAQLTALDSAAFEGRVAVQKHLDQVLEGGATPYIKRGVTYQKTNKAAGKFHAQVTLDDWRPKAPDAYSMLAPMIKGTPVTVPKPRRSAKALQRKGLMRSNQRLVPGRRAKRSRHGAFRPGQMTKALSQVQGFTESGFTMNQRRRTKRGYFLIPNGSPATKRGLPAGIWYDDGNYAWPYALFIEAKPAPKKVDFYGTIDRLANRRVPQLYERALARRLARRGFK